MQITNRGIRRAVGKNSVRLVDISKTHDNGGQLYILFDNGDEFVTKFASYRVLASVVRRWRNLFGCELVIQGGIAAGKVGHNNPRLIQVEETGDHH